MSDEREMLDIPDFLRRGYKGKEKSKPASNDLMESREADSESHEDGELNSAPMESRKCPICHGKGFIAVSVNGKYENPIECIECKDTEAK